MKVDMSPEAITQRLEIQNQLWELTVALQSVVIADEEAEEDRQKDDRDEERK